MSLIDDYLIPFYGLKEGIHDYEFEAGDEFFKFFDNPEVHGGSLKVFLQLDRKSQFLELKFRLAGELTVTCDRCLGVFDQPINSNNDLYVRFGDQFEELSDTVITIPQDETRLNVAQYIYEFAVLDLPLQKIHPDNENGDPGCNQEMLKKLENHSPGDTKEDAGTDPRWDALKKLKSKN